MARSKSSNKIQKKTRNPTRNPTRGRRSVCRNTRRFAGKLRSGPAGLKGLAGLGRFLKALGVSAAVTFTVASGLLNPQWRDPAALEPLLARLGWPSSVPPAPLAVPSGAHAQTRFSECRQFFPDGYAPIVPAAPALRELCFDSFAILHDGRKKTPVFVAQRLNRRMLVQARQIERTDRFYAEARLPDTERAALADYRGSGYSRGHMAPAGDMHDAQAMAQSFSLANMVPQHQLHNAGAWNRIEQDTRKYVMRARGDVHVFTGPVFDERPRTIGDGRVAVPAYLYKVVHDAATGRTWVHWQQNGPDASADRPIAYAEFVRRTGLNFLPVAVAESAHAAP